MSRLIKELGVTLDKDEVRIQCENQQTIRLVNSELATLSTKLRHVDIHNHWLRQEAQMGKIEVVYTPSSELMADGLTKALAHEKFLKFVEVLGLVKLEQEAGHTSAGQDPKENTEHVPQEELMGLAVLKI